MGDLQCPKVYILFFISYQHLIFSSPSGLLKFQDFLCFLLILKLSYSKPFYITLKYASTANIQEVMKFYNLGDQSFETDNRYPCISLACTYNVPWLVPHTPVCSDNGLLTSHYHMSCTPSLALYTVLFLVINNCYENSPQAVDVPSC